MPRYYIYIQEKQSIKSHPLNKVPAYNYNNK